MKDNIAGLMLEYWVGLRLSELKSRPISKPTILFVLYLPLLMIISSCAVSRSSSGEVFDLNSREPSAQASYATLDETRTLELTKKPIPSATNAEMTARPFVSSETDGTTIAVPPEETSSMPVVTPDSMPTIPATPVSDPICNAFVIGKREVGTVQDTRITELWRVDLQTNEAHLLLSSAPGAVFDLIDQYPDRLDSIYVSEMRDYWSGNPIWQLYKVDLASGESESFFDSFLPGAPELIDTSYLGKWLRVRVEDPEQPLESNLFFLNFESREVVESEETYLVFAWSPIDPDTFAYSQAPLTFDHSLPFSVMIKKLGASELVDEVKYRSTDWGDLPVMRWSSARPNQIFFFVSGSVFLIDLLEHEWIEVANNVPFYPGDDITISSRGDWLTISGLGAVEVGAIDELEDGLYDLGERTDQTIQVVQTSGDCDCLVLVDEVGQLLFYSFEEGPVLLKELSFDEIHQSVPNLYPQVVAFQQCFNDDSLGQDQ